RQVVSELRPSDLSRQGLPETLRSRVAVLDRVHTASVTFSGDVDQRLPHQTEEAVLRVAEEALHNALRHSGATHVAVTLNAEDGRLTLEVVDDGGGFDVTSPEGSANRLGLASMRERSRAVKGQLSVESNAESGTTVRLVAP